MIVFIWMQLFYKGDDAAEMYYYALYELLIDALAANLLIAHFAM